MPISNTSTNGVTAFRGISAGSQYDPSKTSKEAAGSGEHASVRESVMGNRIGFGRKTTPKLYMLGTMQVTDQYEFYIPEEERNSLARVHRSTPVNRSAEMRFEGSMQFERMHELFSMVLGHASGAVESATGVTYEGGAFGTGSATRDTRVLLEDELNRWVFKPSMSKATVPEVYTWRYGDNAQFYEMYNSFAKQMDLRYEMNTAVMQSMELFGRALSVVNTLGVSTQDVVHDAVSQLTDVYLDNIGATPAALLGRFDNAVYTSTPEDPTAGLDLAGEFRGTGLTSAPGLLSSMNITMPSGFEMTRYSSGDLDFSDYAQMVRSLDIEFTMRHSTAGRVELAKYRADSNRGRFVRLVTKGPNIRTLSASDITTINALDPAPLKSGGSSVTTTSVANDEAKFFYAVDASILYNEPPQLFTDYNGDDVFVLRGNSYHEPQSGWDRDYAVLCQTKVASCKYT